MWGGLRSFLERYIQEYLTSDPEIIQLGKECKEVFGHIISFDMFGRSGDYHDISGYKEYVRRKLDEARKNKEE